MICSDITILHYVYIDLFTITMVAIVLFAFASERAGRYHLSMSYGIMFKILNRSMWNMQGINA